MARRRRRPVSPYAPWNYAQIIAEARRRLNAQYDPAASEIRRGAGADTEAIKGAALAAAQILRDNASGVQAAYDTAGKANANFAGGFTADMAAKMRAAQAAAAEFSKSQGAPAPAGMNVDALQNASYAATGYIPSGALEAQGAAARTAAEAQPGIAARQMEQDVQHRLGQEHQDLMDLAAKRPDMLNQILDELYKREMDKLQARTTEAELGIRRDAQNLYERQFGETTRHHVVSENQANKRLEEAKRAHNQAVQRANAQGRQVNASASKSLGHLVDQYGRPIRDNQGRLIKVSKGSSSGMTPAQQHANIRSATKEARSLLGDPVAAEGTAVQNGQFVTQQGKYKAKPGKSEFNDGSTNNAGNAQRDGDMTFVEALDYIVEAYGVSRKQARAILKAAGWKPDGQRPQAPPTAAPSTRAGN